MVTNATSLVRTKPQTWEDPALHGRALPQEKCRAASSPLALLLLGRVTLSTSGQGAYEAEASNKQCPRLRLGHGSDE